MSRLDHAAPRERRTSHSREGFALPLAIMVLALLSIGLVAGFAMSTSEQAAIASQKAQARAYSYAQMGLEAFLTQRKEFKPGCTPASPYTALEASACAFCPQCWLLNAAPGDVNTVRGLKILFAAEASDTVPGYTGPKKSPLTTAVFFKNTRIQ